MRKHLAIYVSPALLVALFAACGILGPEGPNCGQGETYSLSGWDTLAVRTTFDTLNVFVIQNYELRERRITPMARVDSSLGDTVLFYFALAGRGYSTESPIGKNFEWRNDTLRLWFTLGDWFTPSCDSVTDGGWVLRKALCTPVPDYIEIDSLTIEHDETVVVKVEQDTSYLRD